MAESRSTTPSVTTPTRSNLSTPSTTPSNTPSNTPLRHLNASKPQQKPPRPKLTLRIPKRATACLHCKASDLRGCSLLAADKLASNQGPCTRCIRNGRVCVVQGQLEENGGAMRIFRLADGRESEEAREEGERVWEVLTGKGERENWVLPLAWGKKKSLKRWQLLRLQGNDEF